MYKKILFILTLFLSALNIVCKPNEQIIDSAQGSSDVELMFSIDQLVNSDYYVAVSAELKRNWGKAYYEKIRNLIYFGANTRTEIPDSAAEKIFKIKKGYYVAAFDSSKLEVTDKISNFYSESVDLPGALVYFGLENNKKRHLLNVIVKTERELQSISDKVSFEKANESERKYAQEAICNYFALNRKDLFNQIVAAKNEIDTTASSQQIRQSIKDRFSFECFKIDLNRDSTGDYIVVGRDSKCRYHHSFTAVVFGRTQKVILKTHSEFKQAIKIKESYYLLYHGYKPDTGIHGYSLYEVDGDELKNIFSDYAYST